MVGIDGSEPSKHALRWALFLAQPAGWTVEAVTAWSPLASYGWMGAGFVPLPTGHDFAGVTLTRPEMST